MNVHNNTAHNNQNVETTQIPSTDEGWINEMCGIYLMEYHSSIKRNELLIHTTTRMTFHPL